MSSVEFAQAARSLGAATRAAGFDVPAFRSPPRQPGLNRSLRRRPDGSCIISVRIADRPLAATIADMIDGVVAANDLQGSEAARLRDDLWAVTTHLLGSEGVEEPERLAA